MARLFAAAASVILILIACQNTDGPLPSGPGDLALSGKGDCPQAAVELIAAMLDRGLANSVKQQCQNIQRQFSRGETADAFDKLGDLTERLLDLFHQNRLRAPSGMTVEDGLARLIVLLNEIVGFDAGDPDLLAGALSEEGGFGVCTAGESCEVVTGDDFGGFSMPASVQVFLNGAPYDGPFAVGLARKENTSPFPGFELGEDTFPLFYDIFSIPEGITFADNGFSGLWAASNGLPIAAVCVLDPPHPLAPHPDDVPDLRLAHLVDGVVEVLPLADPGGLIDCAGVNDEVPTETALWRRWTDRLLGPAARILDVPPLYARPGPLGGSISSFSSFGAVLEDGEEELSCNTVTFEGIDDLEPVGTVFGTPNVTFGDSWLGLIDQDADGSGNFANEPSPSTVAFFLDAEPDLSIDFDLGSRSVSFFYSASEASLPVTADALNAAGGVIDSAEGNTVGYAPDGADCAGDPTGDFCLWDEIALSSTADDIRSVRITGATANQFGIDDLAVCTGASSPPVIDARVPSAAKAVAPAPRPARRMTPASSRPGLLVD